MSAAVSDTPPSGYKTSMLQQTYPVLLMVAVQIPATTFYGAPSQSSNMRFKRSGIGGQQSSNLVGHALISLATRAADVATRCDLQTSSGNGFLLLEPADPDIEDPKAVTQGV